MYGGLVALARQSPKVKEQYDSPPSGTETLTNPRKSSILGTSRLRDWQLS